MSFELAEGYIDLTLEHQTFEAKMASVRQKLALLHDALIRVSAVARTMLFAGGAAMGYMVKQASDVGETVSKFEAVFKDQSDSAKQFATKLAGTINRSKYDLMSYMATLQDTFVPLGFARDEAAEMSKKVTALAEDLASFNNLSTAEVLMSLQSALVGNHETVRKFGVVINEAALNQELLNMGVKDGTKGATEQQKALARLNIIYRSTSDAQGDAERTANSFANRIKGLQASVKDVSVEIGTTLLPSLSIVIEKVRSALLPITEWVSKHQELAARIIYTTGAITAALAAIPLYTATLWVATQAVTALKVAMISLQVITMFFVNNPLVSLMTALGVLAGYLIYTRIEGEDFNAKMATIGREIVSTWEWVKTSLVNIFVPILPIWNTAMTWIRGVFKDAGFIFKNFDDMATLSLLSATLSVVKFANDVKYWFTDAMPQYLSWFGRNWILLLSDMVEIAKVSFENMWTNIKNFFFAVMDWLDGGDFEFKWTGLTEGFKRATEELPKIMERNLTPVEKGIQNEIDNLSEELGKKYVDYINKVPDVKLKVDYDNSPVDSAGSTPNKKAAETAAVTQAAIVQSDKKGVGFVGINDIWNRMASSLSVKDSGKQQLETSKKQLDEQKKTNEHLEKMSKKSNAQYGSVGP